MSDESDNSQFSTTDVLKRKVIEFTINQCIKACGKQEPISDESYETGFIRGTRFAKGMLWKYTPDEIREPIKELYVELDAALEEIDQGKLNDDNKKLNKRIIADKVSVQVMDILLVVLQHSPLSTEFAQMEVYGDFKDLISKIRSEKKVELFTGDLEDEQ